MKINISDLRVHPINDDIYSVTDLSDLVLSLQTHGQLEPIVLNKDNTILSGHRRYFSMVQLGWVECEVRYSEPENEIVTLIEHNRSRIKSVTDILNESRYLERELKKEIGRGRNATTPRNGRKMVTVIEVSKKLGLSTTQLKKIKSISNYEPTLLHQIDLGEMSVNSAYDIVREKYIKKSNPDIQVGKEEFQKKFKNLIRDYNPLESDINDVLRKTYPYSISGLKNGENKRQDLINHLDTLKKMDVREVTLYRKFQEVKRLNPKPSLVNQIEKDLWIPTDINNKKKTIREIERLFPVIEFVEKDNLSEFNILRVKTSTMSWDIGPGRSIKCIVRNKSDGRYIGCLTLSSDFIAIENRDNFIGWDKQQRLENLTHLSVVSTCHSTQPLGFNFLGGKLMASLVTSPRIRNKWFENYGERLVGLTTTSLYGQFSMYNRIPYWKSLGETKGNITIKPDGENYKFWCNWLKENFPDEYKHASSKTSPKQNIIHLIFKYLDISTKDYQIEHRRGIYFSNIYKNGREFLCGEIKEDELLIDERFDSGIDGIMDWWVPRAITRYEKLHDTKKLNNDTLWYNDINSSTMKSWFISRGLKPEIVD